MLKRYGWFNPQVAYDDIEILEYDRDIIGNDVHKTIPKILNIVMNDKPMMSPTW